MEWKSWYALSMIEIRITFLGGCQTCVVYMLPTSTIRQSCLMK